MAYRLPSGPWALRKRYHRAGRRCLCSQKRIQGIWGALKQLCYWEHLSHLAALGSLHFTAVWQVPFIAYERGRAVAPTLGLAGGGVRGDAHAGLAVRVQSACVPIPQARAQAALHRGRPWHRQAPGFFTF